MPTPFPTPNLDAPFSNAALRDKSGGVSTSSPTLRDSVARRRYFAAEEAQKWFDSWMREEQKKRVERRDQEVRSKEKELGLPSYDYLLDPKYRPGAVEELGLGVEEGITRLGQLAAGLASALGSDDAELRRKMYKDRASILEQARNRMLGGESKVPEAGDVLAFSIPRIPEYINPVAGASKLGQGANIAWHALRGYAPEQSLSDAAISAGANVAGERLEDLVTKGKGLIGNAAGTAIEESAQQVLPSDLRKYLDTLFAKKP